MESLFCLNEEVKKKPVVIYGTEALGQSCLKELLNSGVNVEYFCSTIPQECGTSIQGKQVISIEDLLLLEDYNIVLTVENYKDVLLKLRIKLEQNIFMYRNVYSVCLM